MKILNSLTRILFASSLLLSSLAIFAGEDFKQIQADNIITQLYHTLNPNTDIATRIDIISEQFLNKPYELTALGEGASGKYDKAPLYRTDAFDCETFVDTILAIALANNLHEFKQYINKIRYQNGNVSYINRNHFTCLDWNLNNQKQGFLKDITLTIGNAHEHAFARALIDKPSWYRHYSVNKIRVPNANERERTKLLAQLKKEGSVLPKQISIIPYIPLTTFFDAEGHPNETLLKQIPDGVIIEIVRPNWNLKKEIGTHLNVSHLGFGLWKNNILIFRDSSSLAGKSTEKPLVDYLKSMQSSPTIKGINIQKIILR